MNADDKRAEQGQRVVGVYDRPAGADRARTLKIWVWVLMAVAGALSVYIFFVA